MSIDILYITDYCQYYCLQTLVLLVKLYSRNLNLHNVKPEGKKSKNASVSYVDQSVCYYIEKESDI